MNKAKSGRTGGGESREEEVERKGEKKTKQGDRKSDQTRISAQLVKT